MRRTRELKTTILLLILHTSTAKPGKSTAPAVFEVINEQSRKDDTKILPYGNPLAGNSLKNAKIHAEHQQAMFNAERVRQHRAQLQRWNKQPPRQQVDSYMKAYQESQENHHLALEQMQSGMKEKKARSRLERPLKDRPQLEPVKVTRADAVEKNRNHRSYGSVYTGVQKKRKLHAYPGPMYDQGVTIKPNGNVGLNHFGKEQAALHTEAIPSKTQYVYPKLYGHMHGYQSANDINALNTLLSKPPQEQLQQLNTLIHTGKDSLDEPIDLFFYLKDPHLANVEPVTAYAEAYTPEYVNHKDHTPITEEIDDVQDTRDVKIQPYQPTVPSVQVDDDTTTTKSNYYKIEVEQTVSGNVPKNIEYSSERNPNYEALTYEKPLNFYHSGPSTEGVKYLQSQPTGVQHLSEDGTGVSAYGDDDVSIQKSRSKRDIESELFIFGNNSFTTEYTTENIMQLNLNKSLVNLEVNCTVTIKNSNETVSDVNALDSDDNKNETLPSPEELKRNRYIKFDNAHQVGEAYDYDYSYEEDDPNNKFDYSYDNDYDPDYGSSAPDYDYDTPTMRNRPKRPNISRRPNSNQHFDNEGGFSNQYKNFRHPNFYDYHSASPNRDYGAPNQQHDAPGEQYLPPLQYESNHQFGPPSNSYGVPIQYSVPVNQRPRLNPVAQISKPISQVSSVIDSLEPVYMLTESQIKDLVGQQKLNIEHLDVFQLPRDSGSSKTRRPRYPRQQKKKHRKRFPRKGRKNKAARFRKLNKIVLF